MAINDFDAADYHAARQQLRLFVREVMDKCEFPAGLQVNPFADAREAGANFECLLAAQYQFR
jgi:hypothetical protein